MTDKIIHSLADSEKIRIGWCVERTACLGPYERFALWLQGCSRQCAGCIAPDMQSLSAGREVEIEYLAGLILNSGTEGITISGGEPFYQADKVLKLIKIIKSQRCDYGVIIYSGFTYNQLLESGEDAVEELLAQYVDLLIDGEYIQELDDDCGIRGSSNQQLVFLTNRYRSDESKLGGKARQADFFLRENRVQLVGVPSQATKKAIEQINSAAGRILQRKNQTHRRNNNE